MFFFPRRGLPKLFRSSSLTHVTRRTIISDTLTNLIKILDEVEKIFWKTEFDSTSNPDFYVLRVRFFFNINPFEQ